MSENKRACEESPEGGDAKKIALSSSESTDDPQAKGEGLSSVVAAHYNTIEEKGLAERNKSRILHMRNFNNWIKSMLINEYSDKYKKKTGGSTALTVLDMCCGKGGDLLKWRKNNVKHLICADLAEVSVEQCKSRYNEMKGGSGQNSRNPYFHQEPLFSAEFITADCTRVRLKEQFQTEDQLLDIVSCQFSFHYSFESLPQAECMIRNASECLRPGGYFIGTMPNANDIVMRQRKDGTSSFGNEVYKIKFNCDVDQQFPLFGAQYDFFLEGVVNCPEFLVYFPMLIKLAKKYGLKFIEKEKFRDYYERMRDPGRQLLGKMNALETYPAFEGTQLQGPVSEYVHAEKYLKENQSDPNVGTRVGTLSQSEWEAISLYLVFAFEKEEGRED